MNLFERLKQLKLIQPDADYQVRSKRDIMASPVMAPLRKLTVRQVLTRLFEAGVAGALVALFIFIITGSVANSPLVPAPFAAINPNALHAEAQAIDFQIKLADMAYQASISTGTSAESTAMNVAKLATPIKISATATASAVTSSAPVSLDTALQALSQ